MFQHATSRAISLSLLLTASIIFQTIPLTNSVAFAQKRKPVQGAPVNSEQPQPPVDTARPQPIVTEKGAPLAGTPTIVAAKVDAWDDSATPDGKAEPGQVITYSVTITNTGTGDATGVTFTDSVDTNTTLVAGSISTQPVGFPDTYNVIGNVRIQPNAAQGLLANDIDPDKALGGQLNAFYKGQFIVNVASGIKDYPDLKGKKFTFPYTPDVGSAVADDCRHSSKSWAQAFEYAVDAMGGPVGMGSDFNGAAGLVLHAVQTRG